MNQFESRTISPIISNQIESLVTGNRIPFENGELESTIHEVAPGKRRYIALTTYGSNGEPVGICDFMWVADSRSSVLESPIIRKRPDLNVPALELRREADVDGIYVTEKMRGSGIGTLMLSTAMKLAKRFGSKRFVVRQADRQAGWYKKLGGKEILGGFEFTLK